MSNKVCSGCGATYRITKHTTIMRDRDSIECSVCGTELKSWNGAVFYSAERISMPANASGEDNGGGETD